MKKISYISIISATLISNLSALEFGQMGNISASMGGAGVALKDSPWGLYYNPALIGADNRTKFGYSISIGAKTNKAVVELISKGANSLIEAEKSFKQNDFNSLLNLGTSSTTTPTVTTTALLSSATLIASATSTATSNKGILDSLGMNSKEELNKFLKEATGGTITDSSQLKNASNDDLDKVRNKVDDKLKEGGENKGVDTSLLRNALMNIPKDNLNTFLDKVSNGGNIDSKSLMESMGGSIIFSKSDNPNVAKLLDGVDLLLQILNHANIKANTYMGTNLQIGLGDYGGIAVGIFGNVSIGSGVILDKTHSSLIIQSNNDYYQVKGSGDKISFSLSSKDSYDKSSLLSNNAVHTIYANSIILSEVPIGYGKNIESIIGDISIGFTLKYMNLIDYGFNNSGGINNLSPNFKLSAPKLESNFGVDAGILYSPIKSLSIGLVGKNLNRPGFKQAMSKGNFYIDPQIRAGIGYQLGLMTLAFDADITKNRTIIPTEYSRFVGGGALFNFKMFDLRIGAMKNLESISGEGVIITAGANILGLIDIALQSGTNLTDFKINSNSYKIPNYLQVSVGGSFSF